MARRNSDKIINIPPVMRIMQGGVQVQKLVAPVTRYTRFVHLSKLFLLILVAGMVVLVVWIASGNSGVGAPRMIVSAVPHADNLQNIMMKPRYQGVDVHNQPYTVVADRAVQKDKDTVVMETVRADLMRHNGSWLGLNSATGELNTQSKQMQLNGGVSLFADGGYEFRTDHAQVDIQKANAYGDSHIEGQGPPGTIEADSFSMDNHEHAIHFDGSVRVVLYR